ncbi:unnamed protein product [Absidia cylindrospora]
MKFISITLTLAALCLLDRMQAAPAVLRRDGGDRDGGKDILGGGALTQNDILKNNNLISLLSSTKAGDGDSGDNDGDRKGGSGFVGGGLANQNDILSGNNLIAIGSQAKSNAKRGDRVGGKDILGGGAVNQNDIIKGNNLISALSVAHTDNRKRDSGDREGGGGFLGGGAVTQNDIIKGNNLINALSLAHANSKRGGDDGDREGGSGFLGGGAVTQNDIIKGNNILSVLSLAHANSKRGDDGDREGGSGFVGGGAVNQNDIIKGNNLLSVLSLAKAGDKRGNAEELVGKLTDDEVLAGLGELGGDETGAINNVLGGDNDGYFQLVSGTVGEILQGDEDSELKASLTSLFDTVDQVIEGAGVNDLKLTKALDVKEAVLGKRGPKDAAVKTKIGTTAKTGATTTKKDAPTNTLQRRYSDDLNLTGLVEQVVGELHDLIEKSGEKHDPVSRLAKLVKGLLESVLNKKVDTGDISKREYFTRLLARAAAIQNDV